MGVIPAWHARPNAAHAWCLMNVCLKTKKRGHNYPNDKVDTDNVIKYIINLMLFVFAISTSACYAGGTYFPIKITNIQTILQKEHHIYFSLLQKVGSDNYPYPLDDCKTAILHIKNGKFMIKSRCFLIICSHLINH